MSRDHQSFLKLIGMEEREPTRSVSLSVSSTKSKSQTEWDLDDADLPAVIAESMEPPEMIEKTRTRSIRTKAELIDKTEVLDFGTDLPEKTELITVTRSTRTEKDPLASTHIYTQEERAQLAHDEPASDEYKTEIIEKVEKTETYGFHASEMNEDEAAPVEEEIPAEENHAPLSDLNEPRTQSLRTQLDELGAQEGQSTDEPMSASGRTKPFDYMTSPHEPGTQNKTAHFDYDSERGDCRLVLLEGQASARAVHLKKLPMRMGRDPANEFIVDDVNVSRFHAEIREQGEDLVVVDLGSTNGVKVNGKLVPEHVLKPHDIVQLGDCLLEFLPPGVLSKGAPQIAALEETASRVDGPMRRRLVFISIFVMILAGVIYLMGGGKKQIEEAAQNAAADAVSTEVSSMKTEIERQMKKPLAEIPPEDLKKSFLAQIESSPLAKYIPSTLRSQLDSISAPVLRSLMANPELVSEIVKKGGSPQAINETLMTHLNHLIDQKSYSEALVLAEFLHEKSPDNESLKRAVEQLKEVVAQNGGEAAPGYLSLSADEKEFYKYIDMFDRNYEELVSLKNYDKAREFSTVVVEKLKEVIEKYPVYSKVAEPEVEKWQKRLAQMERKSREQKSEQEKTEKRSADADDEVFEIKSAMDRGDVNEARAKIEHFLKEYPDHPQAEDVLRFKVQMDSGLTKSFESSQSTIERFLQTEAYENAWQEAYRFLDLVPDYKPMFELKDKIEKLTKAKATQYYNQARVYEFEADDLIAAEQYYKRSMEAADPRGELYKKASRRHGEVRRKMIQ